MRSGGLQLVLQTTVGDGLSFDSFSFCQDGGAAPEVDVGRGEVADALVVAAVVVVVDERRDLGLEIARQEVIFQQDAIFERLVPALDLSLGHRMIRRTAQVLDAAVAKPFGQVASEITRTVVGQQPGSINISQDLIPTLYTAVMRTCSTCVLAKAIGSVAA